MSEREVQELRDRIVNALMECGIEPEAPDAVADRVIAAIEWDAVIVSSEEWDDVRMMRETISDLNGIVLEWQR